MPVDATRVTVLSVWGGYMPPQSFSAKTEAVVVTVNVTHQQLRAWRAGLWLLLFESGRRMVEWANS